MQAHLKRLHFEAAAIVMAELKSRAMDTTPDGARKLPLAEKAAQFKEQEARFPGLRLKGELQPSWAIVDLIAQVKETNYISWNAPSKCSKRDSEVQNSLKEKPMILSLEARAMCPSKLEGFAQKDANGQAICWAFNQKMGASLKFRMDVALLHRVP